MKQEIIDKVNAALLNSDLDALLVFGYDNIQYITGAYLHYPQTYPERYMAVLWAKNDEPVCILPHEWNSSFQNLSWIKKTVPYIERPGDPAAVIEPTIKMLDEAGVDGKIGVDTDRIPLLLFNKLEQRISNRLTSCVELLRDLRIRKSSGELKLLKEVVSKNDHAIAGQAHHVLVVQASTEMSNTENVRVHAIERNIDEVGHHAIAQVTAGTNSEKWWPGAPMYGIGYARVPKEHEWMRLELVATLNGYWSNGARMLTMGDPSKSQLADYKKLVQLREVFTVSLKPGMRACDVYNAVMKVVEEEGIDIEPNLVLGAGIGVSNYEPPYISASDNTVLETDMIIVFTPTVHGSKGELLMNKDTFLVTEEGNRIIGWWKDWREPFIANYTY